MRSYTCSLAISLSVAGNYIDPAELHVCRKDLKRNPLGHNAKIKKFLEIPGFPTEMNYSQGDLPWKEFKNKKKFYL